MTKEEREALWMRVDLANKSIKQTQIKRKDKFGNVIAKDYAEVNQRVKAFRYVYPQGQIKTEILNITGDIGDRTVLMRATAYDDEGLFLADGYAEEYEKRSSINATSLIENAQTSAIGRCLGFAGFGIDTAIASFEEMQNVTEEEPQEEKHPTVLQLTKLHFGYSEEECANLLKRMGVKDEYDLPRDVVEKLISERKDIIAKKRKEANEEAEKQLKGEPLPFY